MGNLQELDAIAKANGGNRAFGFPGYKASVDYILSRTQNSTNFVTYVQDFPALWFQVKSITFSVGNESYWIVGPTYSPSTSAEGLTAPLVLGVNGPEGCTNEAYADLDVQDKIVLVQRGACPDGTTVAGRIKPAAAAGAIAVIAYSDLTTKVTGVTLQNPGPEFVPAGYINKVDGEALKARLDGGEEIDAYFQHTQVIETRITQNIFTETKGGDPTNVVMLGAHLDSVQAGAGINDGKSLANIILTPSRKPSVARAINITS